MPSTVTVADLVEATNQVLRETRHSFAPVTAETPLDQIDFESIDFVELFIVLEETTGAVFDLSRSREDMCTVADLLRYRQV